MFMHFLFSVYSTKSRAEQNESAAASHRGILVYIAKEPRQQLYLAYWGIISKILQ